MANWKVLSLPAIGKSEHRCGASSGQRGHSHRFPNGARYEVFGIGPRCSQRQHTHAVVSHQTPNLQGAGDRAQRLGVVKILPTFWGRTLELLTQRRLRHHWLRAGPASLPSRFKVGIFFWVTGFKDSVSRTLTDQHGQIVDVVSHQRFFHCGTDPAIVRRTPPSAS